MNYPNPLRRQKGQSMVEYAVVGVALATALLVPVPFVQPPQTAGQLLAGQIRAFYNAVTFFLSLP
ncbi:MAG TPA: hypothetical protein VLX90_13120 [Steroidobacteraceae bacterium]|nr:hypothetical protein [Steroidobacteraceae bacterium]